MNSIELTDSGKRARVRARYWEASVAILSVGILEPVDRVLKAWPAQAAGSSGVILTLPGRMPVCAARAAALVVVDTQEPSEEPQHERHLSEGRILARARVKVWRSPATVRSVCCRWLRVGCDH